MPGSHGTIMVIRPVRHKPVLDGPNPPSPIADRSKIPHSSIGMNPDVHRATCTAPMSDIPPDPRAVIDARIRHLKKQTLCLDAEFIEAQLELERAKEAVRRGPRGTVPQPVKRNP